MNKWKCAIARGNTEFSLQFFGNAILLYNHALDVARCEFKETVAESLDEAIGRVVICHFNLADCYVALDDIERACDHYLQAQRFLTTLDMGVCPNHAPILRHALAHAAGHINLVWLTFVKKFRERIGHDRMLQFQKAGLRLIDQAAQPDVLH